MGQLSHGPAARAPAGQRRDLRRALSLSLANQALASGGNFLLSLYLARQMALEQFGIYSMCYGACTLYVGIGNALLLTQMTVTSGARPQHLRDAFAGHTLCGVVALGGALLLLALPAAALMAAWHRPGAGAIAFAAVSASMMLGCEFFVSHAYLRRREGGALQVNAATLFTLSGGMAILTLRHHQPQAAEALALYALATGLAALLAYASGPLRLRSSVSGMRSDWRASWQHGRWALGGVAITWVQAQSATYMLAAVLGPAGAGLANLSRLFITPFSFLLPAVNKVALPRLAALSAHAPRLMQRLATVLTLALSATAILYSLLLLSALDWLGPRVLGQAVPGLRPLVTLWCLVLVAQMVRSGGAQLLQLQLQFRRLTLLNLPTAALALLVMLALMQRFAHHGALVGMLAGEVVLAVLIWKEIRHGNRATALVDG
ncbi:hypothetical protein GTP56_28020 [Duganella sp. FT134W]|uniref:Oligosaccharide flippase family protein n=1 Tax=Duganella margarita TaxID=2692170 RepID=A0A7X4H634_9BURK|nr:hypothetical protein [Duganella margarita]MYM76016.1 hypothetical protein [Duganella margarita]